MRILYGVIKIMDKVFVKYLILLLFLANTIFITGCSKQEKEEKIAIHFIAPNWADEIKRLNPIIKQFEELHHIKIKVEYTSDIPQRILLMKTSNLPLDIVYLYDTAFPNFVNKGIFQPLNEFIENDRSFDINDFYTSAIKCGTFNGKIYAIPPCYGTIPILYNKTMFNKAGVPYPKDGWTWEEFRETCKKLTIDSNRDGKPEQFGCLGMEGWFWIPMIFQNGGRVIDDSGKCVFNSKAVLETLQFVMDMYTKDNVFVTQTTFPGAFSGGGNRSMGEDVLFATGKVAMIHADMSISKDFPATLDWDIVAPPEKKGGKKYFHVGFFGYAMTSNAKNKKLTWEFIKFLTSKEVVKDWVHGTKEKKWKIMGIPARKSLKNQIYILYPGKHMESYLYCLQYPEFSLAQAMGVPAWQQAEARYNFSDIVMGRIKGDLKTTLDKFKNQYENIK